MTTSSNHLTSAESAQAILTALGARGVTPTTKRLADGRVAIGATPSGALAALPDDLRAAVRLHKDAVIAAIEERDAGASQQAWGVFDELLYRHRRGQTAGALHVPSDVVAYLWTVKRSAPDTLEQALRLTSRDGHGHDTATACLLAAHATLCARLARAGIDTLPYRAPVRLLVWHMRTKTPLGPVLRAGGVDEAGDRSAAR